MCKHEEKWGNREIIFRTSKGTFIPQLYFLMEDHGGEGMIFSSVYYLDYLSKLVLMLETLAIFTKVKLTKLTKLLL